jgi:hypothetical protein
MSTEKPSVEGLMALLKPLEQAAGAMIVNAGGRSFYDAQDARNAAREAIRTYATSLCAPSVEPVRYDVLHEIAATFNLDYNAVCRAARSAASPSAPQPAEGALARFNECGGMDEPNPLERLRFFCSLAMKPQDWLDVEPLFDAVASAAPQPVAVEPRYQGPAKLTPEEQAMGNKGIRWVTETYVAGRPTEHDVLEYLETRGDAAKCGCAQCQRRIAVLAASSPQEKDRVEVSHCSGCGLPGPNPCGQLGCPTGVKVEGGSDA